MPRYKLQVQDDDARPEAWRDVRGEDRATLLFDSPAEARAAAQKLFPVLIKMEQFQADRKRVRVITVAPYDDIDHERDE